MSPARRPMTFLAVHSQAPISKMTATRTNAPILVQGRSGMSRVGTGCAWPGRLDAVCLRPAGSAPSRTPLSSALWALECEIDEGTALPLLDDHCKQQDRPNAGDCDCGRALQHRFQRGVPHRHVSPEDA